MKTVFTQLSPVAKTYPLVHHLYYIKHVLKADRVYLCIWDSFVLEYPLFARQMDPKRTKMDILHENVQFLEHVMEHFGLDYKILYFSEAWARMFKKPALTHIFEHILSKITYKEISERAQDSHEFEEITLSKMNYIVADYVIASYLDEIFPEIAKNRPEVYVSGERFRVFSKRIITSIEEVDPLSDPPKSDIIESFPFIIHPKTLEIPEISMRLSAVSEIFKAFFHGRKVFEKEIDDYLLILGEIVGKDFVLNEKPASREKVLQAALSSTDECVQILSENTRRYYDFLSASLRKDKQDKVEKNLFVQDGYAFKRFVKPLNELKIAILRHCDGKKTSYEISKILNIPLTTVSVYFGRLKRQSLISNDKRPRRLVKHIIIDLDTLDSEIKRKAPHAADDDHKGWMIQ